MVLVDSPRLTDADRQTWAILFRRDCRHRIPVSQIRRAKDDIHRFLCQEDGLPYVSVSWGKDSVVVAHLVRSVAPGVPLAHGSFGPRENPDSAAVRDEYLSLFPCDYRAFECPWTDAWFRPIENAVGRRRIAGIRAQESSARRRSAAVHGVSTDTVCRPILGWSMDDVFGYLAQHDLPTHPAYAMSAGGTISRVSLRVDAIGGENGADRGRRDWERTYYGDILDAIDPQA